MVDEGPSPEDLRRFSGETGYCPECGAEVWDGAGVCPSCGAVVAGDIASRHPVEGLLRRRWLTLVAVIVGLAFLMTILRLW